MFFYKYHSYCHPSYSFPKSHAFLHFSVQKLQVMHISYQVQLHLPMMQQPRNQTDMLSSPPPQTPSSRVGKEDSSKTFPSEAREMDGTKRL